MITRRTLLGTAAVLPLISCVKRGMPRDILVVAKQIDDIVSLDPAEAYEVSSWEVGGSVYQKLVNSKDSKNPSVLSGELAESWDISPDGLLYTFHLRPGIRFASGSPVTAEDIVFSLQRTVILNKAPGFLISQFGFTQANVADLIQVVNERTLTIRLLEKLAPSYLLYCLSSNPGGVVEKKVVLAKQKDNDLGNGWLKSNSAGSGAWVLRSWFASERVTLVANPLFPNRIKRVILRHVPDPSTQLLLLQMGDVDIARNLLSEQLASIANDPSYTTVRAAKADLMYLGMNQSDPVLASPQVRQAIKWAIGYEEIQKNIVPNTWRVRQTFLPEGYLGALDENPFHKDVARARQLLAQAGYANGFEVTLDHLSLPPHNEIAQAVQGDLAAIGIKVTLIPGEFRQILTKMRARQHQLGLALFASDYADPNANATFCENDDNSTGSTNRTLAWRNSWVDPSLTEQGLKAVQEPDAGKRAELYRIMQREFFDRSPLAVMLAEVEVAALRKGVSGFEMGPLSDRTNYAKVWKA